MKRFLARIMLAIALVLTLIGIGAPANAATFGAATAIAFSVPPALVIALLVSTVLPLLVGLITNSRTKPGIRATLLAAAAAITGLLSELGTALTSGTTYDIGIGLVTALGAFLVAVGLHFGLFKPTGAAAALQRVGDKTPAAANPPSYNS